MFEISYQVDFLTESIVTVRNDLQNFDKELALATNKVCSVFRIRFNDLAKLRQTSWSP